MTGKTLVCIGGAYVDPQAVIGIDATLTDEDPPWPSVKVTLATGQLVYGTRSVYKVGMAVRWPEKDDYDEPAEREADGSMAPSPHDRAVERARRLNVRAGADAQPAPLPLGRPRPDDAPGGRTHS
jgi:hypothetical protein